MEMQRRDGESLVDYKIRLYQQKNIDWDKVNLALGKNQNPHHTRKTSYGYLECYRDMTENTFDKSIMIINDVHLPFEREDVVEIIKKHAHEITALVIGGDLMDCYSASKFTHYNHLSIVQELIYTYEWLTEIRKILGDKPIYCIEGNHERRFEKEVLKDPVLQNFIDSKILRMFQDGFSLFVEDKKKNYKPIDNFFFINKWYMNIDEKVIVCHPVDFSAVDGKMCEKVSEHFMNKGENFEMIVFGHTHKYSQMTVSRRKGIYTIENGCMCKPQEYSDKGKLGYTPQSSNYTIIKYNDNEPIDYNNIKVYHLKQESLENEIVRL